MDSKIIKLSLFTVFSLVLMTYTYTNICSPATIEGISMENTLHDGDHVFIWKLGTPERGNILAIQEEDKLIVKRCIAEPGDEVYISQGVVYVNGNALNEPYISNASIYEGFLSSVIKLKEDEYIVLGDNRLVSKDSRVFGIVLRKNILGIVKE